MDQVRVLDPAVLELLPVAPEVFVPVAETRAFGVPAVLAGVLREVSGITAAYIYGSWAARHAGQPGQRPVGDIDVLVLGEPDRDQLYAALGAAEQRLARPVQAAIRDPAWLESGSGAFHDTVTSRPLLRLAMPVG